MSKKATFSLTMVLFLSLFLFACGSSGPVSKTSLTGKLAIYAPATVKAGVTVEVSIGPVTAPDGTDVNLLAQTSFGPRLYTGKFEKGLAKFYIPPEDTKKSGLVSLVAVSGEARGEASLTILPGEAVEPVTLMVGARSVIADGEHWSMAVVVPVDYFGNPVAEGTRVNMTVQHPGSKLENKDTTISHLLGWSRIYSLKQAGNTIVTTQVGQSHGPEASFQEVAGWPVPFKLNAEPSTAPADGQKLLALSSAIIRDKNGNILPDGTLVTFVVDGSNGDRRVIPSQIIGGVASAPLQSPSAPTTLVIKAEVFGLESDPLKVVFTDGPATGTFPVSVQKDMGNMSVILQAGPMLGHLGQFIPDGTAINFTVTDSLGSKQTLTGLSRYGRTSVELRIAGLQVGNYTVEVSAGSGHGSTTFSIPERGLRLSKKALKLILWLIIVLVIAGGFWLTLMGAANLLKYFQEGANPASALKIVPNVPADLKVSLNWLPDDSDIGREIEPVTRELVQSAYLRAWLQWNISYIKKEPYDLKTYFAGPALDAVTASVEDMATKGIIVNQVDTAHVLQLHLYSADGSIVSFSDTSADVAQVLHDGSNAELMSQETTSRYDVVMMLEDGNWRIRYMVRGEAIPAPAASPTTASGFVRRQGSGLVLDGQPYQIAGVNYYPQATPWDKFWTFYNPATTEHELDLFQSLDPKIQQKSSGNVLPGLNTLRIFIPFEQFGGSKPKEAMLANLDNFLTAAYKRNIRVIVTLFDFRSDYNLLLWPEADRHLETLLTRYKDNPAILAWDMKNEPDLDYKASGRETVKTWLSHIARLARTYDPNHLLTVGWSSPAAALAEPLTGYLDFISFHFYEPAANLPAHLKNLHTANPGMPLEITEFGLPTWNSFFFPNGHSEPEQAEYYSKVLKTLRADANTGYLAWTLFDFGYVPGKVAGMLPWQTGPQAEMGLLHNDGKPKPAASLLAPGSNLDVTSVPGWAVFLKPFWITITAFIFLVAYLLRKYFKAHPTKLPRFRLKPVPVKSPRSKLKAIKLPSVKGLIAHLLKAIRRKKE